MQNTLALAIQIASTVHVEQTDMGGNPYILHPIRVMMRLRTNDQELMEIAIMHDVVEDDPKWTVLRLEKLGFSVRVCTALRLLTHAKGEPYQDYIDRIVRTGNRDAIRVKLEDLRDNSDITRLKGVRQKDFDRMAKYHKAFLQLKQALDSLV